MRRDVIDSIDGFLRGNRKRLVEDLKALVRIPSKKSDPVPGAMFGEAGRRAMDAAVEMARSYGLEAQVYGEGHYALAQWGESARCIGFFNHIDVVPEGEGWRSDPFEPVETPDYLIGRGVSDNKNGALASLYTVRAVKELGLPVKSRLLLFLGGDEETGMTDVQAFAERHPMPDFSFVVDSMFPVCNGEKGSFDAYPACLTPFSEIVSLEGAATNSVSARVADKARAVLPWREGLYRELASRASRDPALSLTRDGDRIVLSGKGVSKHASEPEGSVNAIGLVAGALASCPELREPDRGIMAFVETLLADPYGRAIGVDFSDAPSGRSYCICRGAVTEGGRLKLHFNPRYCVTVSGADMAARFEKCFGPRGWSVEYRNMSEGYYIPSDDPKILALSRIYASVTGRTEGIDPVVIGAGTYARKLRNAVGFGPTYPDELPEGYGSAHNPNEALFIDRLLEAIKVYALSVVELDALL